VDKFSLFGESPRGAWKLALKRAQTCSILIIAGDENSRTNVQDFPIMYFTLFTVLLWILIISSLLRIMLSIRHNILLSKIFTNFL